ncbi:MAG: RNA polymerase sigma factor [Thiotrichales bacterium]
METQEDLIALIRDMAAGERQALTALYDRTIHRVYALALRITNRPSLAEEVVNDVYMQAWRQARAYDAERAAPTSWLMLLCRSRAIDALRQHNVHQGRMVEHTHEPEDLATSGPQAHTQDHQQRDIVGAALQRLSPTQRQVIELAFYRGYSHSEISEYLDMPLGSVKAMLRRAQETLRELLAGKQAERSFGPVEH